VEVRRVGYMIVAYALSNNRHAFNQLMTSKSVSTLYLFMGKLLKDKDLSAEVVFVLAVLLRRVTDQHPTMIVLMFASLPSWFRAEQGVGAEITPLDILYQQCLLKKSTSMPTIRCQRRVIELYADILNFFVAHFRTAKADQPDILTRLANSKVAKSLSWWCPRLHEFQSESVDVDLTSATNDALVASSEFETVTGVRLCATSKQ
jgi:hypothetical protein